MTTLNRRGAAVSRYDLRYAAKHPLVWLRFWWVHLTVCGMFVTLAVVWTHPLYSRVLGPPLWPIAAGGLAAMVLASALAPFSKELQATAAASMVTFGIIRVLAMVEIAWHEPNLAPLAVAFAVHAGGVAVLGVVWPTWTAAVGARATVEAGREPTNGG
jgi:hypothetical protein